MSALLGALSLLCAGALPPGGIVIGSAGLHDSATTLSVITVDAGGSRITPLGSVAHRAGYVPVGVIVDDRDVVLSIRDGAARDARVVILDTERGTERTLMDEAVPEQAPLVVDDHGAAVVVAVRQLDPRPSGAQFDVVRLDPTGDGTAEVLASRPALWLSPVRGARSLADVRFVVKEGAGAEDGLVHVDAVRDGVLVRGRPRGQVTFHGAVVHGGDVLLEEARAGGTRAVLVDEHGKERVRGLPGLSPIVAGPWLISSTGRKDGSVRVQSEDGVVVERKVGRAGVARPQALSAGGDVVVWLDRGASLPGELWLLPVAGPPLRLMEPRPRFVVHVYGFVPAATSTKEVR